MREIARAARCTPGALYVHFPDKQRLLVAMMDADFALFQESMLREASIVDPVERLRAIGRAYVRFALQHPHHYRLMFMTPMPHIAPGECSCEHGNPDCDGYALLRATVADCIAQGRFLARFDDVEAVTQACWANAHGLVSLYIAHGNDPWVQFKDPTSVADMCLDLQISGLTGVRIADAIEEGGA